MKVGGNKEIYSLQQPRAIGREAIAGGNHCFKREIQRKGGLHRNRLGHCLQGSSQHMQIGNHHSTSLRIGFRNGMYITIEFLCDHHPA